MLSIIVAMALTCGTERWDVKTLTDTAATSIKKGDLEVGIDILISIRPPAWTGDLPRQPEESQTVIVHGMLVGAKLEDDGDVHVVVRGPFAETMIVEFPDPKCTKGASKQNIQKMAAARQMILALFPGLGTKFRKSLHPKILRIAGLIHFDKLHGQTGVAKNGVEIHPVLELQY